MMHKYTYMFIEHDNGYSSKRYFIRFKENRLIRCSSSHEFSVFLENICKAITPSRSSTSLIEFTKALESLGLECEVFDSISIVNDDDEILFQNVINGVMGTY